MVFSTATRSAVDISEAVLGVWLPAPLPTPRALPDPRRALAVGVEKDLGCIDVWPCGIACCSLCGLAHPPSIFLCSGASGGAEQHPEQAHRK